MQTFLGKTAEHLIQSHSVEGLKDLVVVVPSQRSALYLKRELAQFAQKTFVAPKIFAIEDFVLHMSQGQVMDPTELLFKAYDIFKSVEPEMNLDKFIVWGNLMLRDFDLLDMYLVDPNQLYAFLSEVKSIERWGKEYGVEELEQFLTPNTRKYFHLYDNLNIVYHALQQALKEEGKGYRGMYFRQLVNDLQAGKPLPIEFSHLYFVGFNALSKSEEELFRICLNNEKTTTLWDVDSFYIENTYHRAGNWLRDYSNPFSKRFLSNKPFLWNQNFYKEDPKEVTVLGFENPSGQILGALNQIDAWENSYGPDEQIALVLADESLLDQALQYLGKYKDRLNITMGLALKKTKVFELIESFWVELKYQKGESLPFIEALNQLDQILYREVSGVKSSHWNYQHDAIMMAKDQIQLLLKVLEGRESLQIKSGSRLLKQLILQQKISFEGSEKRTLHVMGLLETRNLDFDRVIILSLNEGVLPAAQKRNSLIPMDIASMSLFDLPTFTQADAVTSYHFHRLLQRAKEIVFSYVLPGEKSSAKEESRFIKQLRFDWPEYNPNLKWNEYVTTFQGEIQSNIGEWTEVNKTTEILDKIKSKLSGRGLSPSALNTFSTCSMKYYYAQVLGLRQEQQLEEEMGADVFGTWVHQFLENLDNEIIEKHQGNYTKVNWQQLQSEIEGRLDIALQEIEKEKGAFDVERGFNVILKEVAKNILARYLKDLPHWNNDSVKVLGLETSLSYQTEVEMNGERISVNLQGRVDKIDLVNDHVVRIIDFKTGKVQQSDLNLPKNANLFETLTSYDSKDKLTQLWFYKVFVLHELQKESSEFDFIKDLKGKPVTINPGIISFRNLSAKILHANLQFEEGESMSEFMQQSNKVISFWTNELLDTEQPFKQTDDLQKCKYCDFAGLCRRD